MGKDPNQRGAKGPKAKAKTGGKSASKGKKSSGAGRKARTLKDVIKAKQAGVGATVKKNKKSGKQRALQAKAALGRISQRAAARKAAAKGTAKAKANAKTARQGKTGAGAALGKLAQRAASAAGKATQPPKGR